MDEHCLERKTKHTSTFRIKSFKIKGGGFYYDYRLDLEFNDDWNVVRAYVITLGDSMMKNRELLVSQNNVWFTFCP